MNLYFDAEDHNNQVSKAQDVMVIVNSLRCGGVERRASIVANELGRRHRKVTVLTFGGKDYAPFFRLDPQVSLSFIDRGPKSSALLRRLVNSFLRVRSLRNAVKKCRPQVVISFGDQINILVLLGCIIATTRVVIAEQTDPKHSPLEWYWKILRHLTYPFCDCLIVQTNEVLHYFPPWLRRKARVIANPVMPPEVSAVGLRETKAKKTVVAVGRLTHEKGLDLLFHAYKQIIGDHPEWQLVIWGEGPLHEELLSLATELGLESIVKFAGLTSNIHQELYKSDLFVLPSRFEGLPNALGEAMACGLPVIAFDCPGGGPRKFIRDEIDGKLVPAGDVGILADTMSRFMHDAELRRSFGIRAKEILERFSLESVMKQWQDAIDSVL